MKKRILIILAVVVIVAGTGVFGIVAVLKSLQGNVPIVFYGRLVDQDGNGVPNATVTGEVHSFGAFSAPVMGGENITKRSVSTTTDSQGYFTLHAGDGTVLGLSAEAPGYIGDCGGWYVYSTRQKPLSSAYRPDPAHPDVFKYWKLQGNTHLSENHLRVHMQSDGRVYTIDLLTGKSREGDDGAGDLRVSIKQAEQPSGATARLWTFDATAIHGGFAPAAERRVDFEAPTEGYVPSLAFDMSNQSVATTLYGTVYYLKSRGGAVYASILMYPDINQEPTLDIRYRVNPNGSRLLEP